MKLICAEGKDLDLHDNLTLITVIFPIPSHNSPLLQHLLLSLAENGILDEGFYHFKELLGFPGSLPSIQDINILLNFCLTFYVSHRNLIIRPVEEHRLEEGNVFPSLQ